MDEQLRKIGKKMPYQIPEGFFDKLEAEVWKEIQPKPKNNRRKLYLTLGSLSLAASLLIGIILSQLKNEPTESFSKVEEAFLALSDEDQGYLLEIYQEEDIYINE